MVKKGENQMKKRFLAILLCLGFVVSLPMTASASNSVELDLASGIVLSDTVTDIDDTGENLVRTSDSVALASVLDDDVVITTASVQNDEINLVGAANGIPFNVSGAFCSISENGNVVVFNSVDSTNNFRVVYCAVEKELDKASLYFDSFAAQNSTYNVVTKLYLAPNSTVDGEYIIVELYGNEFPNISDEAIEALPEDHQLNLFWYAKEFKPTSTDEQMITTRAANPTYILLESYTFENLGMTYKHYLRYEEQCDIRDVDCNKASTASATLEVTQKWVDAELENDCSDTSSTLSLKNIAIGYLTAPGTAVTAMMSNGDATRNGILQFDYNFKIGVNIKGLTVPTTVYVTWEPSEDHYETDVYHKFHTNSADNYWRDAIAEINSSYYLNSIGNHINVFWNYSSYSSTPASSTASLVFKFGVDNLLDYTQYKPVEHIRSFTVNVTD